MNVEQIRAWLADESKYEDGLSDAAVRHVSDLLAALEERVAILREAIDLVAGDFIRVRRKYRTGEFAVLPVSNTALDALQQMAQGEIDEARLQVIRGDELDPGEPEDWA